MIFSLVALVWRLPLAVASFVFYKALGRGFRVIMARYNRTHPEVRFRWRPLSGDTLRMKIALPAIMTTGPRWNTHAVVATAGPLTAAGRIAIDATAAGRAAESWSVVVCTFPAMGTVACFGSATGLSTADVAGGDYWLALRYYRPREGAQFPGVTVDGQTQVPAAPAPASNDFYKDLARRSSLLYRFLHYHMWILLRYRTWLPERLVERQYLPLGNPDTRFFFGSLLRGESLRVILRPQILDGHDVYLTFYSPASFPILWHRITEASDITKAPADCSYLVRVHQAGRGARAQHAGNGAPVPQTANGAPPFDRSWLTVEVLEKNS